MKLTLDSANTLLRSIVCAAINPARAFNIDPPVTDIIEKIAGPWLFGRWQPAIDIEETTAEYVFIVDVPGISSGSLEVVVENNVLRITGQREPRPISQTELHRTERQTGRFARNFQLPDNADTSSIHASYKLGVLKLVIPKSANANHERTKIRLV